MSLLVSPRGRMFCNTCSSLSNDSHPTHHWATGTVNILAEYRYENENVNTIHIYKSVLHLKRQGKRLGISKDPALQVRHGSLWPGLHTSQTHCFRRP